MDPLVEERRARPDVSIAVGHLLAGRYRLQARIGAGGMATIYRAWDQVLERDVAVKVLHPHLADDAALLQRFKAEARSAAQLAHPHAVNVFDEGIAGLPFMVLEYVDGPSLRHVLEVRGRLPPRQALAVLEPICAALARAHAIGLVHRDVKPENVLVSSDDGTMKVADFGIARVLTSAKVTDSGVVLGSIHYLAPEVILGAEATPASDQYAVGLILFELLTGQKPLPAGNAAAVALRHTQERVPAPSGLVPGIPAAIDGVVARATALDPAQRYGGLRAFRAALRAAVSGGPQPVVVPGRDTSRTLVIPRDTLKEPEPEPAGPRLAQRVPPLVRRARLMPVAAALVAILFGVVASSFGSDGGGEVPTVFRLTVAEASEILRSEGFAARVGSKVPHSAIPAGTVLGSDPPAGTSLDAGQTVILTVSSGPLTVVMPSVVDLPRDDAVEELEGSPYHFSVQIEERVSRTGVPRGRVQAQSPPPEETLEPGATVVIELSLGAEQVEVPDVTGTGTEEAERLLAARGLVGAFREAFSDDQPETGRVVRQTPEAGARAARGSTVDVVISGGPETVIVPDLWLREIEQAREELEALGLSVQVVDEPQPQAGPFRWGLPGLVERQVPEAGARVSRGGQATLHTWAEPSPPATVQEG